MAPKHDAFDN